MSSYNQIDETRTLAETLGLATTEILALYDEMADLCATIAAQFPKTYEKIAKYQQAHRALTTLDEARAVLDEPLEHIDPPLRRQAVLVKVGKQMRSNRSSSQRVRLGNAVVRLKGVKDALMDESLAADLAEIIKGLENVTFPQRYG